MKLLKFAATFTFVCLCGLFVAFASGFQWGTPDAGFVALMSVFIGGVFGSLVAEFKT